MVAPAPDALSRWRCTGCGNLTRFTVVRTTRSREFIHADLAGEPLVEEREVLGESVESVTCRWCGAAGQVELVERPGVGADVRPPV